MEKLAFPEMELKLESVPIAADHTCEWVQRSHHYQAWKQADSSQLPRKLPVLVIKGVPGAGKSVLMKHLYYRLKSSPTDDTVTVAHFFKAGDSPLLKSTLGCLRSIAYGMAQQDKNFQSMLISKCHDETANRRIPTSYVQDPALNLWEWETKHLCDVFRTAASSSKIKPTNLFIDGLDECSATDARELVSIFQDILEKATASEWDLKICMSTRHYPAIKIPFSSEIIVEEHNSSDISTFVREKLRLLDHCDKEEVERSILSRVNGVFLWVDIVVKQLLQHLDDGRTREDIRSLLNSVPKDLGLVYQRLLESIEPHEQQRTFTLLQWVLLAKRPLSPLELYVALSFSPPRRYSSLKEWKASGDAIKTESQARQVLRSQSRGLLRFCNEGGKDTVHFVHESLREYLKSGGLQKLCPNADITTSPIGHSAIAMTCINLLRVSELEIHNRRYISSIPTQIPFFGPLYYASSTVCKHIQLAAASHDMAVPRILKMVLECNLWRSVTAFFRGPHLERYQNVIQDHSLLKEVLRAKSPLVAACILQIPFTVQQLLDEGADPNQAAPTLPIFEAIQHSDKSAKIIRRLLRKGASVDVTDREGWTPLLRAVQKSVPSVVELMYAMKADFNCKDHLHRTPLHIAVQNGDRRIAGMLLSYGTDPNARYDFTRADGRFSMVSPLHMAVLNNDFGMVRTLVRGGACLETFDNSNRLAYDIACDQEYDEIKEYILRKMQVRGISEGVRSHLESRHKAREAIDLLGKESPVSEKSFPLL